MRRTIGFMLAAAALLLGKAVPAYADNLMAGAWTIARAVPAPWGNTHPEEVSRYVGKRVVFAAGRIDGPDLLGCDRPNYRMVEVPAAGLFQGTFDEFERKSGRKAEDVATAAGFATRPIKTLTTDCTHSIDYHMSDANNAAFMLNNTIYWLKRDGT
jgi:hypothetical protein